MKALSSKRVPDSCSDNRKSKIQIKRSHFAGGDLTPPLSNYRKVDARPLWKPHNFVPASRGGVNIEWTPA